MCFLRFYLDSLHLIRDLQFIIHIFLKHWSWCSKKLHDTFCRSCDILTNLWLRLVSDALILQNLTVGYSWARQLKQPFMASHASTFCKFIIYKEGFNLAINFNRQRLTKGFYQLFNYCTYIFIQMNNNGDLGLLLINFIHKIGWAQFNHSTKLWPEIGKSNFFGL